MARSYAYQNSAQMLYWPAHGPAFFEQWTADDASNDDLLCAEMSRLAYADRATVKRVLQAAPGTFTLIDWIGGETAEQRGATQGTDGFLATRSSVVLTVLAVRCTESNKPEDIVTDALATSIPRDPRDPTRGNVHRGFARAYASIQPRVRQALPPRGRLLVTGHSLGAGL